MPGIIRRIGQACHLRALAALSIAVPLLVASTVANAAYPDRVITLIVPFAAGGPTDIVARIVSVAFQKAMGQSVVVENRGGAAGNIGMTIAARAAPDGYTLLLSSTAIAVNPALFKNLGYDPIKDFAPVSELVNAPNVIVVRANSGIETVADLIARAKAAPGTFNYASPGAGTKSHLTGEQLKLRAGIDMVHVQYRGAGPAAMAVLEGTVQVGSVALGAAEALIKDGQLKALAVTGATRWFSLPDVPTMIEAGFPGFVSDTFNALFAPAGTPPEIVARLAREKPGGDENAGGARAGAQGRLRGGCRHAGSTCRPHRRRDSGREGTGRKGRHQTGIALKPSVPLVHERRPRSAYHV